MEKLNIGSAELNVTLRLTGAEMCSIIDLRDGCEHLWQADPQYWARHAPILFPTVGESRDGRITANGTAYTLGRHGFARFLDFELVHRENDRARFRLTADERTLPSYPFHFVLETEYSVEGDTITQSFLVRNADSQPLAFQLGGHPAFAIPCGKVGKHSDHYIRLERKGNYARHLLTSGGLFSGEVRPFIHGDDRFQLSHELFKEDAIVFKREGICEAALVNGKSGKSVIMRFDGFPHLGIWSVPGAGYVCIEPWIGCADDADGTNDIFRKDSAVHLQPREEFSAAFSIRVAQA
jgi:galactose mutarotase-like enzyme